MRATDEQADEWRSHRYGAEPAPIDEDEFNAEQDEIEAARAKSDAEYARVNGNRTKAFPIQSDCLCRKCFGSGKVLHRNDGVMLECPECLGWGFEGPFILELPQWAIAAPIMQEAAE